MSESSPNEGAIRKRLENEKETLNMAANGFGLTFMKVTSDEPKSKVSPLIPVLTLTLFKCLFCELVVSKIEWCGTVIILRFFVCSSAQQHSN
jgi:hypothetical protein